MKRGQCREGPGGHLLPHRLAAFAEPRWRVAIQTHTHSVNHHGWPRGNHGTPSPVAGDLIRFPRTGFRGRGLAVSSFPVTGSPWGTSSLKENE